jgi:3-deoxy-manno-octulosonate cytidylyltransferase (CMP-KDO synthetase)
MEAELAPVVVACDDAEIAWVIERAGGKAVMTDASHVSGSDRIWDALGQIDAQGKHDLIINLQGDLPTFDPHLLHQLMLPMEDEAVDIATLAAEITDAAERTAPQVVKPVIAFDSERQGRAMYFSRASVPTGAGPMYHHIGVYAYRREALKRFVALPPSALELAEKLEQLRALEAAMRIDIRVVDTVPLGVDTPEDLEKARKILAI